MLCCTKPFSCVFCFCVLVLTVFVVEDKAALNIVYNGLFLLANNLSRIKSQERDSWIIRYEHLWDSSYVDGFYDELYQFVYQ